MSILRSSYASISFPFSPDVSTKSSEEEQQAHVEVLDNVRKVRVSESLQPAHQSWDAAVYTTHPLNKGAVVDQITQTLLSFNHH